MEVRSKSSLRWLLEKYLDVAAGFEAVYAIGPFPRVDPSHAILFCANHVGWWDGFLLWKIQRAFFAKRPVYTVMLQKELEKRKWFTKLGAIPIEPGDPTTLRNALRLVREMRSAKPLILSYFPQGQIFPSTRRPLGFQRGIELFAKELEPAMVIPVGIHVEPLQGRLPTAFLCFGEPVPADARDASATLFEDHVERALDSLQERLNLRGERALEEFDKSLVRRLA